MKIRRKIKGFAFKPNDLKYKIIKVKVNNHEISIYVPKQEPEPDDEAERAETTPDDNTEKAETDTADKAEAEEVLEEENKDRARRASEAKHEDTEVKVCNCLMYFEEGCELCDVVEDRIGGATAKKPELIRLYSYS